MWLIANSLIILGVALVGRTRNLFGQEARDSTVPPVLAVLHFKNTPIVNDVDYEPLSLTIAWMLTSELGTNPRIRMRERGQVRQVLGQLGRGSSGPVDPATAGKAGRLMQADYLIAGTFIIN